VAAPALDHATAHVENLQGDVRAVGRVEAEGYVARGRIGCWLTKEQTGRRGNVDTRGIVHDHIGHDGGDVVVHPHLDGVRTAGDVHEAVKTNLVGARIPTRVLILIVEEKNGGSGNGLQALCVADGPADRSSDRWGRRGKKYEEECADSAIHGYS
jgi:hypothetical protein